jgi:hypothetical protein
MLVSTLTIPSVFTFPFLGLYADNNNLSPQAIGSSASKMNTRSPSLRRPQTRGRPAQIVLESGAKLEEVSTI